MYCIGPGLYSATMAIRSSNCVGRTSRSASRMPGLSNWNTPVESPFASILYVFSSSSGSWSISMQAALEIIETTDAVCIEIDQLPLDDEKTYKMLAKGDSTGVF